MSSLGTRSVGKIYKSVCKALILDSASAKRQNLAVYQHLNREMASGYRDLRAVEAIQANSGQRGQDAEPCGKADEGLPNYFRA